MAENSFWAGDVAQPPSHSGPRKLVGAEQAQIDRSGRIGGLNDELGCARKTGLDFDAHSIRKSGLKKHTRPGCDFAPLGACPFEEGLAGISFVDRRRPGRVIPR